MSGVAVMVLLLPINFIVTMFIRKWQVQQMHYKDERTKMVNEVLNGIKVRDVDEVSLLWYNTQPQRIKISFAGHQTLRLGTADGRCHQEPPQQGAVSDQACRIYAHVL